MLYVDADKVVNVTDLEVYHPLVWNGVKIKLHYATVGELADYLAFTAIRGEVVVQYWLKQGDESVVLDFGGGGDVVEVPGVLLGGL